MINYNKYQWALLNIRTGQILIKSMKAEDEALVQFAPTLDNGSNPLDDLRLVYIGPSQKVYAKQPVAKRYELVPVALQEAREERKWGCGTKRPDQCMCGKCVTARENRRELRQRNCS